MTQLSPMNNLIDRAKYFVGDKTDVSTGKYSTQSLISSKNTFELLCARSHLGLVALDANLKISYVNKPFLSMFELSFATAMDLDLHSLDGWIATRCGSKNADMIFQGITGVFNSDDETLEWETEIRLVSPQRSNLLLKAKKGNCEAPLLLSFQDITKQRETEEQKSEFLATAAHELRTPMASIFGFSELLLQRDFDKQTGRELLEIINQQACRITALINELLDLKRIEARRAKDFQMSEQDLRPIIQTIVDAFPEARERIILDLPIQPALVNVDKQKISQALSNLLSNALKYSSSETPVSILLCMPEHNSLRQISVMIKDLGVGMSALQQMRYGEPFWRADPSGCVTGTGLGVALVKEIVLLHGGRLALTSEQGKGCSVQLCLPQVPTKENDGVSRQ